MDSQAIFCAKTARPARGQTGKGDAQRRIVEGSLLELPLACASDGGGLD
mgnify:CR=1 FL=1